MKYKRSFVFFKFSLIIAYMLIPKSQVKNILVESFLNIHYVLIWLLISSFVYGIVSVVQVEREDVGEGTTINVSRSISFIFIQL